MGVFTRIFNALPSGLRELGAWLLEHRVTAAVMEATGVYWEAPFEALGDAGIPALLRSAQQVKQIRGLKTDIGDSAWLANICQFGLGSPSMIPPARFRRLRKVSRLPRQVVGDSARLRNWIHKVLDASGIRIGGVLSDVFGVNSLWQNPHGVRPAIHPGQTAGDETHAAFGRRSIPAEPRRCAPLIVAFRSKYTRYSSLTRLVSRAPRRPRRSPGFHHRLLTASLRAAHRCVSVEIHPGQFSRWGLLPHAPCQPDPHRENWASPVSALTWVSPQAVNGLRILDGLTTGKPAEAIVASLSPHVGPHLRNLHDALTAHRDDDSRFLPTDLVQAWRPRS